MIDEEYQDDKNDIQSLIKELREANIGFENFKKYAGKVEDSGKIIRTHVNNIKYEHTAIKDDLDDEIKKPEFKEWKNKGYVPTTAFDKFKKLYSLIHSGFIWKTMQIEMYEIVFKKFTEILENTKGYEIERDALQEMREMFKNHKEMFENSYKSMADMFENRVYNRMDNFEQKFQYILNVLSTSKIISDTDKKRISEKVSEIPVSESGSKNSKANSSNSSPAKSVVDNSATDYQRDSNRGKNKVKSNDKIDDIDDDFEEI